MSLSARIAPLLLVGAFASAHLDAQQPLVVREAGPGPVGRRLAAALATPHTVIGSAPVPALLPRDSVYSQTVIILHRNAIIEARVQGDVIVIGGDAFLRPGAIVDGRVIAIGGGVYESRLAITRGGTESHRDFTFALYDEGGASVLSYQPARVQEFALFSLPGLYGVRIPGYDRIDGLSLPFGPVVTLDTGYYDFEPTVTYRSNLGKFDPAVNANLAFGRRTTVNLFVGRTTLTNDDWIWSDLVNSAAVLGLGLDTRNYYRADRAEGTVHRLFETTTAEVEAFVGARAERDRSVSRDSNAQHVPWSFFGRASVNRMLRPNPAVIDASLQSVLLGGHFGWEAQGVRASVDLTNEGSSFNTGGSRFIQTTLDAHVRFPTFGVQEFHLNTHVVETIGDIAPPQRWSYLGGSGTLPTMPLLSMGGDHLLFVGSDYYVPIQRISFPVVGSPIIALRHMIGAAGVGSLPSFHQNLGVRLALSFARVDFTVDPATRSWEFGFGLSSER